MIGLNKHSQRYCNVKDDGYILLILKLTHPLGWAVCLSHNPMTENNQIYAHLAGMLHNALYPLPNQAFIIELKDSNVIQHLPDDLPQRELIVSQLMADLNPDAFSAIERDHYRLFIGPGKKLAYPWGSYYLDPDNLLCGESETAVRQFIIEHHLTLQLNGNEPVDHIGILLAIYQYLLTEQSPLAARFFNEHIRPWLAHFTDCIARHAQTNYYQGIGLLLTGLASINANNI